MLYRHFKEGNVYLKVGKVFNGSKNSLEYDVLYFSFNDKRFYRRTEEEFNGSGLKQIFAITISMKRFRKLTLWESMKFILKFASSGGKKCKI